jgi:hypothetical protein
MLKITRDGEKTIDNERQFNKSLLPRWKQKWLVFKLGLVIVSDTYNVSKGQYDAFFKLRKKVLARLDQIDSNIIDTTLEERLKIAEWFAQEKAPDFIEQVLNAICENFVSWASFDVFGETEEEYHAELEKSKKTLTKWIKKVRKELKSYRDTFPEIEK